ncbi:MAG: hypothetical protein RBU37_09215 [Myxococcota bacterium]|jgi:hypothetical protein|nr:hypothetical protein [Myxococcota bacterium]
MQLATAIQSILDAEGVPYCLIGAHALALRGVARYTADIDFLTMHTQVLRTGFWPPELGAESRSGDDEDPLAGLVRFVNPPVDLVVGRGHVMRDALEGAVFMPSVGCRVVTSLDLALLKLEAGGVQDLADLQLLLEARRLDGEELRHELAAQCHKLSAWGQRAWGKVIARLDED